MELFKNTTRLIADTVDFQTYVRGLYSDNSIMQKRFGFTRQYLRDIFNMYDSLQRSMKIKNIAADRAEAWETPAQTQARINSLKFASTKAKILSYILPIWALCTLPVQLPLAIARDLMHNHLYVAVTFIWRTTLLVILTLGNIAKVNTDAIRKRLSVEKNEQSGNYTVIRDRRHELVCYLMQAFDLCILPVQLPVYIMQDLIEMSVHAAIAVAWKISALFKTKNQPIVIDKSSDDDAGLAADDDPEIFKSPAPMTTVRNIKRDNGVGELREIGRQSDKDLGERRIGKSANFDISNTC